MQRPFSTKYMPYVFRVDIETVSPQKMVFVVMNANRAGTYYIKRTHVVNGKGKPIYLRVPRTPEKVIIKIYNAKNGDLPYGQDKSFKADLKPIVAEPRLTISKIQNPLTRSFAEFALQFAEQCGTLDAGINGRKSVYRSDDGKFIINYYDVIRNDKREAISTPSRIDRIDTEIDCSAYRMRNMTVPMRFIILCHEYSHLFLNKDATNESEADSNAIFLYLELGFPKIEAIDAFANTFYNSPTQDNYNRMAKVRNLVEKHDQIKYKMVG